MRLVVALTAVALVGCEGSIGGEVPGAGGGSAGGSAGGGAVAAGGGLVVDAGMDAGTDAGMMDGGFDAGPEAPVHFLGRFENVAEPRADWSGSGYVAQFTGTGIGISLEGSTNQFAVVIDDGTPTRIRFNGQTGVIPLASGLSNGPHEVHVYRRTEASSGPVRFKGFTVTGGALTPTPEPFLRRIQIVGDSISCGYGNEGPDQFCNFSQETENEYLAYGAITARNLNAEHHTIAWSGRGMVRNYGGDASPKMPELYDRLLATQSNSPWAHAQWVPDVVVINLGTNDFSGGVNPGQPYADAYLAFVTRLRGLYPSAYIFCSVGPMTNDATLRGYVQGVVTARTNAGDQRIRFIEFPNQGTLGQGLGCDYHPSLGTHRDMATRLTAAIKTATGW